MSSRAFDGKHFDAFLTVTRRLGELIDRGMSAVEVGLQRDETDQQRLERFERALIRQRILLAYLLSYVVSELRRDPSRGPARFEQMIERMGSQSDEEWERLMAEYKDRTAAEEVEEARAVLADGEAPKPRVPAPPPTPAELEATALRRQARREARERSQRRHRMLGR